MVFSITWLGHAAFQLDYNNFVVLVDPWLQNPLIADKKYTPERVDAILISHGHFDHIGDTVELLKQHANAKGIAGFYRHPLTRRPRRRVLCTGRPCTEAPHWLRSHTERLHRAAVAYCIHEVSKYLISQQANPSQVVGVNKGGTVDLGGGFKATMVRSAEGGPRRSSAR